MKHCCSYSLLVAFVRSTIGVLAFQLLKPGTLNGAFLFGLLDFSLRFTQSDVFLWEGKNKEHRFKIQTMNQFYT